VNALEFLSNYLGAYVFLYAISPILISRVVTIFHIIFGTNSWVVWFLAHNFCTQDHAMQ